MADYGFYAGILRFVASTSERLDPRVTAMMECLDHAAAAIDQAGTYTVIHDQREYYARALAGVAAFLQKQILPETIAEANAVAEAQVRWAIDTSMDSMTQILQAQAAQHQDPVVIAFPPPPLIGGA